MKKIPTLLLLLTAFFYAGAQGNTIPPEVLKLNGNQPLPGHAILQGIQRPGSRHRRDVSFGIEMALMTGTLERLVFLEVHGAVHVGAGAGEDQESVVRVTP